MHRRQRDERVDTAQLVETPEGVDFRQRPAGPTVRFWAAAVDIALRSALLLGTSMALSLFGTVGSGLQLIITFAAIWGYPIAFEMWWNGTTPGKHWFDLQVRHVDGTPITWKGSIIRNLLRAADFLPVGYLIGLASTVVSPRFQRIGDIAADTIVCHTEHSQDLSDLELPDADPLPVPVRLSPGEQAAIVQFALRSPQWSGERRREIADAAHGLLDSNRTNHNVASGLGDDDKKVEQLQRMASAIVQGR